MWFKEFFSPDNRNNDDAVIRSFKYIFNYWACFFQIADS